MSLDVSRTAVERHTRAMRRQWRWYLAGLAAVLVAVGVLIGVVWTNSEFANATLRTARAAAPAVGVDEPNPRPALAWQNGETAALGAPFVDGTVVTYSRHSVTGRNARSGATMWRYTRTNSTVCAVIQAQGKTLALYDQHCDELTAFDTGTGKRAWERTLDENAMTIHGRPHVLATTDTLFVWTGDVVYAVDPTGGLDRWTMQPTGGCTFTAVVPGSSGVLMTEHCAGGDQLLLRDRYAGYDDKATTADKQNQIDWRVSDAGVVPVAADAFVIGYDPATHRLISYDSRTGKITGRLALNPPPTAAQPVGQAALQGGEVAWIAGRTYLVSGGGSVVLWSLQTSTVPAVAASTAGMTLPTVDAGQLLVPTGVAIDMLAASTGKRAASFPVPAPATSSVYRLGTGFLVATNGSTRVYQ